MIELSKHEMVIDKDDLEQLIKSLNRCSFLLYESYSYYKGDTQTFQTVKKAEELLALFKENNE